MAAMTQDSRRSSVSTPAGVSGPGLGAPLVACEGAGRGRLETTAATPLRVAYADPPYEGQARKHYGKNGDTFAGDVAEVDHAALIVRLCDEFPDGWALSCKTASLRALLPLCPEDVRVLAWVKRFATIKKNVAPTYAWEPVIKRGGRNPWAEHRHIKDWIMANPSIRADRFVGAKPPLFCQWLFACLGLEPTDELIDLFPGTGGVGVEWDVYRTQLRIAV